MMLAKIRHERIGGGGRRWWRSGGFADFGEIEMDFVFVHFWFLGSGPSGFAENIGERDGLKSGTGRVWITSKA